ncbi:GGDEF domain-containing response regulator [Fumia xinanensis]|uniref:Stage 0 sporulation protein A homolog n=1 Tax=Fumia xinanensis TaxID=2763659 RepID=A0A926E634_9FIRM|nr:diguanylate cyclase [Fumia xinanensis]MBC8560253.1 diguanylate cyclase [Fumia xinanensis]
MTDKEKCHKQKILIADDSEMNRFILAAMLEEEYTVIEAKNGLEAVAALQDMEAGVDLVLLDIVAPEMNGFQVLTAVKQHRWGEQVPIIVIWAENSPVCVERAYELGASDYIRRPFEAEAVRRRVADTLRLRAKQKQLVQLIADQIYEKEKTSNLMVGILSHIVELQYGESDLHLMHIQTITEMLLKRLVEKTDRYALSQADISIISAASVLHDIGKISVPGEILNKPGKLTPEEFEQIKSHAAAGARLLRRLPLYQDEPLIQTACEICHWHHERYDGGGYPDGLIGEKIPIAAQAAAIADVYVALIGERVYKKAFSHETALRMIQNGECGQFNPLLLECLNDISGTLRQEWKVDLLGREFRWKLENTVAELLRDNGLSASKRIIRLMEEERDKKRFFDSLTKEVQFEYTVTPSMICFSDWGAAYLGLDKVVMDPAGNKLFRDLLGEENLHQLSRAVRQTAPQHPDVQHNCQIRMKGELRWCRVICRTLWSKEEPSQFLGAIGKLLDINEEYTKMLQWQYRASCDMLTGLLNKAAVREKVQQRLLQYPDQRFVMLMADVDRFKEINDTRGHTFGDRVLKYIAKRLKQRIRGSDIAARAGGDEFLIFVQYDENPDAIVKRVFADLPREYEGHPVSVSMGAVTTIGAGRQYEVLFHRADQALYAAKNAGRGRFCFYDDSMRGLLSPRAGADRKRAFICAEAEEEDEQ